MSQEPENDPDPPATDDPLGLKKGANGIFVLLVVCSVLWALSKFGPTGANWIGDRTQRLFGLTAAIPELETRETPMDIEPAAEKAAKSAPESPATPAVEEVTSTGNSRIDNARTQILEALGGPGKAVVRHIAISEDEKSMVAAVKLFDSGDREDFLEIYFDKDNFGRYISTPDSPFGKEIKVWDEP